MTAHPNGEDLWGVCVGRFSKEAGDPVAVVYVYGDEQEARRQLFLAEMDVPAYLVRVVQEE